MLAALRRTAVVLGSVVYAAACGSAPKSPAEALKTSFAEQVQVVVGIDAFDRVDDELTFAHPNSDGALVHWRVTIDSVAIELDNGEALPLKGNVLSSWYAEGELVEPLGSMSLLPDAFLDAGVAQQCYALWDTETGEWGW